MNVKEGTTPEQLDTFGKTIAKLANEGYSAAVTVVYDRHDYAG